MAIVTASAVQQDRVYVASGFVEDGYILDDKQPVSTSQVSGFLRQFVAVLYPSASSTVCHASLTMAGGALSSVTSSTISRGRLKWSLEDSESTNWSGDVAASIIWGDSLPNSTAFTQLQSTNPNWIETENIQESPFG